MVNEPDYKRMLGGAKKLIGEGRLAEARQCLLSLVRGRDALTVEDVLEAASCGDSGAAGGVPNSTAVRERAVFREFAQRLAAAHDIRPGWKSWLDDGTLVCRCEDVTAGELRRTAELTGARGLRSLKLTTRAGLGICQGRTCGRTVEDLIGNRLERGRSVKRPIATPVRLGELAAMERTPHE